MLVFAATAGIALMLAGAAPVLSRRCLDDRRPTRGEGIAFEAASRVAPKSDRDTIARSGFSNGDAGVFVPTVGIA